VVNITLYIEELKKDTIVNEINLKEKALSLPAIKAKWVARLINHKNNLNTLEKRKKNIIRDALPRVKESLPVKLSDNFIKEKAEETTEVISIVKDIDEEKMIIDFLERTEKVISSMSYDMSNIIKIVQLETL
jgi:hypothetical protein